MILGTNKVPSIFGTSTAAVNYFRKVKPDLRLTLFMAAPALLGSVAGARLASSISKDFFRPFILVMLVLVALYTWKRPHLGLEEKLKFTHTVRLLLVALFGLTIGFYDGIFGPGTGTFLIYLLVGVIGYGFLKALQMSLAQFLVRALQFAEVLPWSEKSSYL